MPKEGQSECLTTRHFSYFPGAARLYDDSCYRDAEREYARRYHTDVRGRAQRSMRVLSRARAASPS